MDTTTPRNQLPGSLSIWNVLLGIWLIASPFVLAFSTHEAARWNNIIVGAVIGVLALARMSGRRPQPGLSWVNVLLGLWTIASPFVLAFSQMRAPLWNNVIVGAVVAIVAWAGVARHVEQPAP